MSVGRWWKVLEHPADIGIEAGGKDSREAFEEAAKGMMAIVVKRESVGTASERTVELEGRDQENLLVRWLSEILYLFDGEQFVVAEPGIRELTTNRLSAVLRGEQFDPLKHEVLLDVKAVTYHQLAVASTASGCRVRVFFDI